MKRKAVTTIAVTVNGREWGRAVSFRNAGPDDAIYVLDQRDGAIRFGDGSHGRTPPVGSTIGVSYRDGAGSAGNISKHIDDERNLTKFWVVVQASGHRVGKATVMKCFWPVKALATPVLSFPESPPLL
jgi:hypothetical protein